MSVTEVGPIAPGSQSGAVLEVSGLRTEFRLRRSVVGAVDDVSFEVRPGECVGLVGESGCGKSTIGLSVMKLLPNIGHVTGGSIRLLGRELASLSEHEMQPVRGNDVAMIFQDPLTSLNPTWTIGRQIEESVRLHRDVTRVQARERAIEVLNLVGVPRPAERVAAYPHQLSGGLRQRVMIAMALACEPRLLIADEPTTALDVTIQAQILDLLDDLRSRLNMAVLLITHNMGVIASRADKVMVMYAGKIVESASTGELFRRMHHPYTQALLDSIPRIDQDRSAPLFSIAGLPPDLSKEIVGCRFAPRCPRATEICSTQTPPLTVFRGDASTDGDQHHLFACFHPVGGPLDHGTVAPMAASVATASVRVEITAKPPERVSDSPILSVQHLVKEFAIGGGGLGQQHKGSLKAVSDVSFELNSGTTFGLVGESGCGKTTIGRLVVGLEEPTDGVVSFEGENLLDMHGGDRRRKRREMQLMFQDSYSSLDPRMRVEAILREPLVIQGIGTRRQQDARVQELLAEVGLSTRAAELYPHEFSGGQRQRIGLARALALHPKLIVADEPVSALDVSIQAQIINLMCTMQERHDLTYLVISHDLAVVRYLADEIGVMYLGKIVETGPADQVYEHPAHPYTRGLLDAVAIADPEHRGARRLVVQGELPSSVSPPSGCRFRTRCPFAAEICAEEAPPMRLFGLGHLAACHFPLESPLAAAEVGDLAAQL